MLKYNSNFQGYSCKFSPFKKDILACAYSQYYGIIGNGKIIVFSSSYNSLTPIKVYDTNQGVFDISFSEANQNHLASCGGDGSIKLWDFSLPSSKPLLSINSHMGEIWCINWSHLLPTLIATAGSDKFVKIIDISNGKTNIIIPFHSNVVYSCVWHPTLNSVISSTSADGTCCLFDIKSNKSIKTFVNNCQIMHCDFNKYDYVLALAHSNGIISLYDLRGKSNQAILVLNGHSLTTRKIAFSPFDANTLISVSYDMNVNLWNTKISLPLKTYKHHTEFVYGVDWNLFDKGTICTTSWDNSLCLFNVNKI